MQAGIELKEHELRAEPLGEKEIRALLKDNPASLLYSKRGRQNKVLGIDPEKLTDDELIALMAKEPALIRRPSFVVDGELIPQPNRAQLEAIARAAGRT